MSSQTVEHHVRYCGRLFSSGEIERIRRLIAAAPDLNRAQLSRQVCDLLGWLRPDGGTKDMSCRVAMLRMERDGLITLPPPEKGNGNGRTRPRITSASNPRKPLSLPVGALDELVFVIVQKGAQSSLWNEFIERYHYLGYKPLPGAQMRYFVSAGPYLLAALGFGAAAWKVAPRDGYLGWTPEQRKRNLHLIVNNARFLILPWIMSQNLASKILSSVSKRLPADWRGRYGYSPVLLETYVETDRFRGTCYKAANWIHVGQTQGRGKLDRYQQRSLPRKEVFLCPLQRRFRKNLLS